MKALGMFIVLVAAISALDAWAGTPPVYLFEWGTSGGGNGNFNVPRHLALDGKGNLYVVDQSNHRIQVFTTAGSFVGAWGSQGNGAGQFKNPVGVALAPGGDVYVVDSGNHRIQKFTSTGTFLTQWGSLGSGDGQFSTPYAVAVDDEGTVFVADGSNHRIQKFTGTGNFISKWGSLGSGDGQFQHPGSIKLDGSGRVYVADVNNHRIQVFNASGEFLFKWGSRGTADGQFVSPADIAFDPHGSLYVCDMNNHRVQHFTSSGDFLTKWGTEGTGAGEYRWPDGVAVSDGGDVFIADALNNRIQKFGTAGRVHGQVSADCAGSGTMLASMSIDAFAEGSGDLGHSATTDETGAYDLPHLEAGDYTLTLVIPLGYTADVEEVPISVAVGQQISRDFSLDCLDIPTAPRGMGFWKHQVGVATGGSGKAQISATELCEHLDAIAAHFNSNAINQVVVYEPPAAGTCPEKLDVARQLLNLKGDAVATSRARQHLMSLLLNVAAGLIGLSAAASEDGVSVSQAITYCDHLIDDPDGDHDLARQIAETINNGGLVVSGIVPANTRNIAYGRIPVATTLAFGLARSRPNPFRDNTTMDLTLPTRDAYSLSIYDVAGRLIRRFGGTGGPGTVTIVWDGCDASGARLDPGLYFARLRAGGFAAARTLVLAD